MANNKQRRTQDGREQTQRPRSKKKNKSIDYNDLYDQTPKKNNWVRWLLGAFVLLLILGLISFFAFKRGDENRGGDVLVEHTESGEQKNLNKHGEYGDALDQESIEVESLREDETREEGHVGEFGENNQGADNERALDDITQGNPEDDALYPQSYGVSLTMEQIIEMDIDGDGVVTEEEYMEAVGLALPDILPLEERQQIAQASFPRVADMAGAMAHKLSDVNTHPYYTREGFIEGFEVDINDPIQQYFASPNAANQFYNAINMSFGADELMLGDISSSEIVAMPSENAKYEIKNLVLDDVTGDFPPDNVYRAQYGIVKMVFDLEIEGWDHSGEERTLWLLVDPEQRIVSVNSIPSRY